MKKQLLLLIFFFGILSSCDDDDSPDLEPIPDRVNAAITDLRNQLVAPPNGWKLEYQPTPESGFFFVLLDFDEDGTVNIQTDVVDNDGEFLNQTIFYRIDNSLGLELILENYAAFHYLFELDGATFGAEFEFLFKFGDGQNLFFESKSDFRDKTTLMFEPADANDANSFSTEIATNLNEFAGFGPQLRFTAAGNPVQQQLILDDEVSVFWDIDLAKRNVTIGFAGIGTDFETIVSNPIRVFEHTSGYSIRNGQLVLQEPFEFVLGGRGYNLSSINLNTFEVSGPSLCQVNPQSTPKYSGAGSGVGSVTIQPNLLSFSGASFTNTVYTVNADFLFDGDGNSLTDEDQIVGSLFPTATGFGLFYGVELNDPEIPIFSTGVFLEDGTLLLREIEPTSTQINKVSIRLLDNFYSDREMTAEEQANLISLTNDLYSGGEMYAYEIPIEGLSLFRLFNPCNNYDLILVGP
ncbi:MAG: DUF4302 domain-containing protein [Cyclobacteriaceae bacterium]